jgi:hypothetical protein
MSGTIRLVSWDEFQHYGEKRAPVWLKLHRDILTSESWICGTDLSRLVQVASMLLAARYQNAIPMNPKLIIKVASLDCTESELMVALQHLKAYKFVEYEEVTDACLQPASTLLAKRYPRGEERREEEKRGEENRLRSTNAVELDDSTDPADPIKPQIEEVFAHWRTTWNHPRGALDVKRRKLIRERLKQYDVATLCQAITGYTHSPHHCGRNDRNTVYDDLGLLLRDAAHVDAGLRFYANPPRNLSKTTLANIDAAREFIAAGETQP